MVAKKTGKRLTHDQIIKQASLKAARRGSLFLAQSDVNLHLSFLLLIERLKRHWAIDSRMFDLLVRVSCYWSVNLKGITIVGMTKEFAGHVGGSQYNTFKSYAERLTDKGLLEVIGRTEGNARIYAPTPAVANSLRGVVVASGL